MGGFFSKVDEKYGDGDREYNWARGELTPLLF